MDTSKTYMARLQQGKQIVDSSRDDDVVNSGGRSQDTLEGIGQFLAQGLGSLLISENKACQEFKDIDNGRIVDIFRVNRRWSAVQRLCLCWFSLENN